MDYQTYSQLYDAEYADYTEDVHFYVKWARRCPGRALELGCGTGRVLTALAKAGCPVTGLESSSAMLERARLKWAALPTEVKSNIEFEQGDMRDFDLGREFSLIYMPFREFMHLYTEEDQLACLESAHRHLSEDGRLIINLYNMDLVALANQPRGGDVGLCRQRSGDYVDPTSGQQVYLTSASWFKADEQLLVEERFYDRVDERGRVVDRQMVVLKQRWFFRWEMAHLLHRANFRVEQVVGGYHGQARVELGSEMIFVARRARLDELEQEIEWLENQRARLQNPTIPKNPENSRRRARGRRQSL